MGSRSKSCRLGLYRIMATVLLLIGIILNIVGISTPGLFVSLLKGREAAIRRIDIFFGLFASVIRVEYSNGTLRTNRFATSFMDIEATSWSGAQAVCTLAILTGLIAIILHFLLVCGNILRKWYMVLIELILQLFIVAFLIAGVALVETQLYFLNVYGDTFLLKLLRRHDLLRHTGGPLDRSFKGPRYTYWIIVAADFCYLFALLCCLPEFISVVDEKRRRKREEKYPEWQKPTRV